MTSTMFSGIGYFGKAARAVLLVIVTTFPVAHAQSAGEDWSIGAAQRADASAGVAVSDSVPAPAANSPSTAIRHSTEGTTAPAPRPQTQAAVPAGSFSPAQSNPSVPAGNADHEDADPTALTAFRSDLDPYGRWVDDSKYGRVWVPDGGVVGSDFAPYVSRGRWALDVNNEWVWESEYPFGAVVFHYGRWVWIDGLGWSWVPGRRYAPAWVVWRVPTGDYAYVGWAPAPPTFVWYSTGAFWLGYYPPLPFVFCPSAYVFYPGVGTYLVRDRYFASRLVHHSAWYSTGPVYGHGYRSPPIHQARVPARFVPTERVSAYPRASAYAQPRGNMSGTYGPSRYPRGEQPGFRAAPGPRRSTTIGTLQDPSIGRRSPQYSSPSNIGPARSAPQFSAPIRSYSAPSYSSPSRSSSPPHSMGSSAPSRSFSAPSPSRSFSGGGFRSGGGGGFRSGGGPVRHR